MQWVSGMFADMARGGYLQVYHLRQDHRLRKVVLAQTRKAEPKISYHVGDQEFTDLQDALKALDPAGGEHQ